MVIPAMEQKGSLLLEDVGVPLPELGALVRGIEAIAAKHELTIAVIAHAGDGNTHPLIVFDPMDADQSARAQRHTAQVMDLAIGLGGTITGEHGVGRLKKPWLPRLPRSGRPRAQPAGQGRTRSRWASSTPERSSDACDTSTTDEEDRWQPRPRRRSIVGCASCRSSRARTRWFTINEIAESLGISRTVAYRLIVTPRGARPAAS